MQKGPFFQANIILNSEDITYQIRDSLQSRGIYAEHGNLFTKDQFLETLYAQYYIQKMSSYGIIDDAMSFDEWKNTAYWDKDFLVKNFEIKNQDDK